MMRRRKLVLEKSPSAQLRPHVLLTPPSVVVPVVVVSVAVLWAAVQVVPPSQDSCTHILGAPDVLSALEADAADPAATFTDIVNAISSTASDLYSILLPTADIINALVTSLPAYDTSVFTDSLSSGDYLGALGLPIAATTGISTLAAGFEYDVIQNAFSDIAAAWSGLF